MKEITNMSRRDFIKKSGALGGGLVVGIFLSSQGSLSMGSTRSRKFFMPNAFIRIGVDGSVTIIVNKSEMGQGVYTSLPMLVVEELEVDWSKVRVEAAPVNLAYNHTVWGTQVTGGSTSVWSEFDRLRKAGAAARLMLISAAAETWKVRSSSCRAEKGWIIHEATKRRLSYGQLVEKAAQMKVPESISLKKPKDFKIIGRPMKRLDTLEKTNGKAIFGIDKKMPGILTALVSHAPVFGGEVKHFNAEKTKAVPGVRAVVQIESGVAVVADSFWSAHLGRGALEVFWNEGPNADLSTSTLREEYANLSKTPGAIARREGDPAEVFAKAAKHLNTEYEVPYLAHATMEPLNCVVDLRQDRCDIWTGTQSQTMDRDAAAQVAGLKPEQVQIHTLFLGGGFGRRANPQSDFVVEAVRVAKAMKKPIQLIWTREDDMKAGYYRPMWYDRIAAGLDSKGDLIAWKHTIVGQSILQGTPFAQTGRDWIDETSVEGAKEIPYEIPNILVDLHTTKIGVPVQWWRSVGHSHTAFVVESFMDEIAHATGKDPYEFRRKLLAKHPRHRGVLELAAQKAGWGKPLPAGNGQGIAVHKSFESFIAQVAEVSVSPSRELRVHRVVCSIDCGRVVNPDTIEAQMESGIVFGLTAALYGKISLTHGRIEQSNFHDYRMLRIDEMPKVEVYIVQSEEKPGGVGEPGVPPIAPAVCNAIFAAIGKRIRRLPILMEDLKKA